MNDIPPISGGAKTASVTSTPDNREPSEARHPLAEWIDRVEISEMAQALSTIESRADIRVDKVQAIREAIANGTYETDDRIRATVDRLLQALRSAR